MGHLISILSGFTQIPFHISLKVQNLPQLKKSGLFPQDLWDSQCAYKSLREILCLKCFQFLHPEIVLCFLRIVIESGKKSVLVTQYATLWDPMDCSPPDPSVHGIFQARTLQWVAMPSSRGPSPPRDWTCACYVADSLPSEPPGKPYCCCPPIKIFWKHCSAKYDLENIALHRCQ